MPSGECRFRGINQIHRKIRLQVTLQCCLFFSRLTYNNPFLKWPFCGRKAGDYSTSRCGAASSRKSWLQASYLPPVGFQPFNLIRSNDICVLQSLIHDLQYYCNIFAICCLLKLLKLLSLDVNLTSLGSLGPGWWCFSELNKFLYEVWLPYAL